MEHTFLIDNYVLLLERKKQNLKKNAKNFLPTQYNNTCESKLNTSNSKSVDQQQQTWQKLQYMKYIF